VQQGAETRHADGFAFQVGRLFDTAALPRDQHVADQRIDRAAGEHHDIKPGVVGLE
jgi:hypothetical protein